MNHIKQLRQEYRKALREYEDAEVTYVDSDPLRIALRLAEDALQDALDDAAEANSVMIHAVLREVGSDMVQIAREMQKKAVVTGEVQP